MQYGDKYIIGFVATVFKLLSKRNEYITVTIMAVQIFLEDLRDHRYSLKTSLIWYQQNFSNNKIQSTDLKMDLNFSNFDRKMRYYGKQCCQ